MIMHVWNALVEHGTKVTMIVNECEPTVIYYYYSLYGNMYCCVLDNGMCTSIRNMRTNAQITPDF